eukprot:CAMPEP_0195507518 /NCGR_PEP_ID=MMETSP0794_2-20130614/941_1 /TAXON_ID=515487 /ORGANISM="Stephanopyxis turris, Strain CCMP 815" /LENGTH=473 /DNA_ID=CAMNT_0040634225 /DNA_START=118 /DNA_END=1539 /DNA_ORIENTATION=-
MGRPKFSPLSDILVGIVMAGTSVPQLVAYAETVGYAGYRGLATAGYNLLGWGVVTGSPWMNSGVTAVSSLMTKADLDGDAYLAKHGEEAYVKLVASYSLYVAMASVILAVLGFGKLASSVPKPVRAGFKWGCSVGVVSSAIPNGILARGTSTLKQIVTESSFLTDTLATLKTNAPFAAGLMNLTKLTYAMVHVQLWALAPAIVFFTSTAFVMNGSKILPKSLPPGMEVIIATVAATVFSMYTNYASWNYGVVGEIPVLDPSKGVSLFNGAVNLPVELFDYKTLLFEVPLVDQFGGSHLKLIVSAFIFAAISFLTIVGIASGFETENGIAWSPSRELFGQGVACGIAGVTGSAPCSGSLSRSLVARLAGGTSQLSCIVTALCWICFLPCMSIMSPTPKAALSAVIISAVIKSVVKPKELLGFKGLDIVEGWVTAILTATTSPTMGFAFGCVLSLVLSLGRGGSTTETVDAKKKQ